MFCFAHNTNIYTYTILRLQKFSNTRTIFDPNSVLENSTPGRAKRSNRFSKPKMTDQKFKTWLKLGLVLGVFIGFARARKINLFDLKKNVSKKIQDLQIKSKNCKTQSNRYSIVTSSSILKHGTYFACFRDFCQWIIPQPNDPCKKYQQNCLYQGEALNVQTAF